MDTEFIKKKPSHDDTKTVEMRKRGRPVTVDRSYAEDAYVKKWLTGLDENTKGNYIRQFKAWLDFIKMTPTQQIELRIKQMNSMDMTERQFFEAKWREFKAFLESTKKTDSNVKGYLKCVASFFSRNFGKRYGLALVRGDWISTLPQPMKALNWIPSQSEIKTLYTHANFRNKALLLCLYHTGLSECDICELTIEGFPTLFTAKETEHIYFEKYREKSTVLTATCLSFECTHDLREMLAERGNPTKGYLFLSQTKHKDEPLTTHGIQTALKELVKKTFGDEKAREFETRHLRDSYHSAIVSSGIVGKPALLLMGHNIVGSEGKYAVDREDIRKAYENMFPHLGINGLQARHDVALMKSEVRNIKVQTSDTIIALTEKLVKVEKENEQLKAELTKYTNATKELVKDKIDESHMVKGVTDIDLSTKWRKLLQKLESA